MGAARWLAAVVTLGCVVALGAPRAFALTAFGSDCNFGLQTVFAPTDTVCATGDFDIVPPGETCAAGYLIVAASGGANPFTDLSADGANYVETCLTGGTFIDEVVWTPPLAPGAYDLVINQHPFGAAFGPEDLRVVGAFSVALAPEVPLSSTPLRVALGAALCAILARASVRAQSRR